MSKGTPEVVWRAKVPQRSFGVQRYPRGRLVCKGTPEVEMMCETGIKICGMRRKEDIEAANACRPDYIGFILSPGFR